MTFTLILCGATCLFMILSIFLYPTVKVGKLHLDSYVLAALTGALVLLCSGRVSFGHILEKMTENSAVNPLKILCLFLSMTFLSVFLDELGFFSFLAVKALEKSGTNQKKLFFYLYFTVSVLTVFTSNDVIILTFTPFICYFSKNAGIDPLPYLFAEFIAANTWSMALIIGNPTNIYLATSSGVSFFSYFSAMLLPTVLTGLVALLMLWLLFRKKLQKPMEIQRKKAFLGDRPSLILGILLLSSCTVTMAVSSYFNVEMWIISLGTVLLLCVLSAILSLCRRRRPSELWGALKRLPYAIIPFVLSMFVLVLGLNEAGFTGLVAEFLGREQPLLRYGLSSFLAANVVNNIPMSVFYSSVLEWGKAPLPAVYATVIGSNIGAFLTPIGALAGIMWSGLLRNCGVPFQNRTFLKYGVLLSLPAMGAALLGLFLCM